MDVLRNVVVPLLTVVTLIGLSVAAVIMVAAGHYGPSVPVFVLIAAATLFLYHDVRRIAG